ncbi:MAG: hypothetical protein M0R80_17430 [Proteobacteria bacterium]|jgi:hypothetical protein|nr:hypothetical protein [Pseudomonadota bacterium]
MGLEELKQIYEDKDAKIIAEERHAKTIKSQKIVSDTILGATTSLIRYLEGHTTQTEVINQLESINTPDSLAVIPHIQALDKTMKGLKNTDLTEVTKVMTSILDEVKNIPKENIEIPEPDKQIDYSEQFKALKEAIDAVGDFVKDQKLISEAPIVNVPETKINVEAPDLKPLQKDIATVVSAINKIVIPEYKTDNKAVEELVKKSNELLKKLIDKPVSRGGGGGGIVSYVNSAGTAIPVTLTESGEVPTAEIKPTNTEYTWVLGTLTKKVEMFADKVVTTDYTWVGGNLTEKTITVS